MLVITRSFKTPSVKSLLELWAQRYRPTLPENLSSITQPLSPDVLFEVASSKGRALTVAKLSEPFIEINCQMAGMQTNFLYANIPNVVDLNEARQLTRCTFQVYKKVLEIYRQQSLSNTSQTARPLAVVGSEDVSSAWGKMPAIEELATALDPILLELQEQHIASNNWRTLGFLTTLLNLSSKLMLRKLTPIEEALLKPYFKFIEEQVALPWQRVCIAAAKHPLDSPTFTLVEQMLPKSHEIAQEVYRRLVQSKPNHCSRRGRLSNPEIAHSTIRDLEMFQGYLWLCVLEESLEPIEMELIDLCVMVMTGMDVKWELTEQFVQLLMDEVMNWATPEQIEILLPYIQGIQQAFFEERLRFSAVSRPSQVVFEECLRLSATPDLINQPQTYTELDTYNDRDDNSSSEIERLNQKLSDLNEELAMTREQLAMHLKNPQLHKRVKVVATNIWQD